jgi:uncharacterized protein
LLAVLLSLLAFALPAAAQTFPPLSGRVVDDAQVLDAQTREALTGQLAALEARNGDQVVVATVRSLEGYAIEDYANRLFRRWGLGQAATNNGVLLLIAPNDRKVRIEVGYGLEGTLTDAVAKLIIANDLIPPLRAGRFDRAAAVGVDDIAQVLTGGAADWQQRARAVPQRANQHVVELPSWLGFLMFATVCLVGVGMALLMGLIVGMVLLQLLLAIGVLPNAKARKGGWEWLNYVDSPKSGRWAASHPGWASSSSSSSGSSSSFSGGGGSSGGGGASGSW